MRQVFLDTETTGLEAHAGHRIVELGCVEMVNRRLSGRQLHCYLNPERRNHEDAVKVHGLSDVFLADQRLFAHVVDELLAFVGGAEVLIHNAPFDVAFLDAELARVGRRPFHGHVARVSCSLVLAREIYPGKANSLDALCKRLEVDNTKRTLHGALLDAGLLAEVYLRMTRGQNSLVIDDEAASNALAALEAVDFGRLDLPVLYAEADDMAAHERLLAELDAVSGGRTVWRRVEHMA